MAALFSSLEKPLLKCLKAQAKCIHAMAPKVIDEISKNEDLNAMTDVRYLGPHLNWRTNITYEIKQRINRGWVAFRAYTNILSSKVNKAAKLI